MGIYKQLYLFFGVLIATTTTFSACNFEKGTVQSVTDAVANDDGLEKTSNVSSLELNIPIPQSEFSIKVFTRTPQLCQDQQGPDCARLTLGDDFFSTTEPKKGHLYSCNGKNPNAPGSREGRITWIDFTAGTWNILEKLWLPESDSRFDEGEYSETVSTQERRIIFNNMPVDKKIGDWPMTRYPTLTKIDGNPGVPLPQNNSVSYPLEPKESNPTCLSLGPIGVTKNGVALYHAADARGEDALAREIVDVFGGHPARSYYHYHFIPERLDNDFLTSGHSRIVGYIKDGFPIYGYRGEGGIEMTNDDLDICHGHNHGLLGYHYHATIEYPYTVGCYKGTPK